MIDFVAFHKNLLGIDPQKTPKEFRLTDAQERLYAESHESARHGYLLTASKELKSWEHLVATFILAYGQTQEGSVTFAVSAPTHSWANAQIKKIAHHIFALRASLPKTSLQPLFVGFQRMAMGSNILQLMSPPDRWVAYGFSETDVLPPWMRNRLLNVGQS